MKARTSTDLLWGPLGGGVLSAAAASAGAVIAFLREKISRRLSPKFRNHKVQGHAFNFCLFV